MKDWWLNLSIREKQTVLAGSVLVAVFLIYAIIWSPLANSVASMREEIHDNQVLLTWMQEADRRIQQAQKTQHPTTSQSAVTLLSVVQTELNKTTFAKNASQLQEVDTDSVLLRLQNVNFDELMQWLLTICPQHSLVITEMTVKPNEALGIVDADIRLSYS